MSDLEKPYILSAPLFSTPTRILIVTALYRKSVSDCLCEGAVNAVNVSGATYDLAEVPSASEIPTAIKLATAARYYDGFVALGCVIEDETTDMLFAETTRGLTSLGLEGVCIGNAVLYVEKLKHAKALADIEGENRGGTAAIAAMHLIRLKRRFTKTGAGRISPSSEHILMAGEAKGNQGTA